MQLPRYALSDKSKVLRNKILNVKPGAQTEILENMHKSIITENAHLTL